jgi:hypothetical protein
VEDDQLQAGLRIEGPTARVYAAHGVNGFVGESSTNNEHLARIFSGGGEAANLGVVEGRRAGVRLSNEQGSALAVLAIAGDGTGQLRAVGADNASGVTLGGNGHGGGNVVLWKAGQEVASLRTPDSTGAVNVFTNGGTHAGHIGSTQDGSHGLITVNDSGGTEVGHFTIRGTGGSFCVRLRNGNAHCLLPLPR